MRLRSAGFALVGTTLVQACGNNAARSPSPPVYEWPERFAYRVDYVSEAQRGRQPILHYAETKTTRFDLRDGQYLGTQDSVLKTSQRPGEALRVVAYAPEDTLGFYLALGRHGEISKVQLACDPAITSCAAALPSSVALEIRRVIPRLPVWPAPRGSTWDDTLEFDETWRPGGTHSAMITRYAGRRDTVISARAYWVITWHSVRHALRSGSGDLTATLPTAEDGVTLVEKARLIPVFATWAGVALAPPELRAMGATATGYRGRAYLTDTLFDSLYSRQVQP